MAIRVYLEGQTFDGETIRLMGIAFEIALASLGKTRSHDDPIRAAVARSIIADGEIIMSNNSKTSSREIMADELNQVTGGWGPMFLSRIASSPTISFGDIRGEQTDKPHSDGF
jgi:hypothetical protein